MDPQENDAFQVFREAEEEFDRLQDLFHDRVIGVEEFTEQVDALQIVDEGGEEWQIGLQTGKWYRKQEDEWVEDDPYQEKEPLQQKTDWRLWFKRITIALLAVVSTGLCMIAFSLLFNGLVPRWGDILGEAEGVEEQLAGNPRETATLMDESEASGGGQAEDPGALPTLAVSEAGQPDQGQTPSPSPLPTMTSTPLPPPPRVPPQVWEESERELFSSPESLGTSWSTMLEKDLEYEFLAYEGDEALFLQFSKTAALWYADGASLLDVDRSLRLTIPNPHGTVSLACRYSPETSTGYLLQISQSGWQLVYRENGGEVRLEEGVTSDHFRGGGYSSYRLRCTGSQVTVWENERLVAAAEDVKQTSGLAGIILEAGSQAGVVILAEAGLSVLRQGGAAQLGDTIWLDVLAVQFVGIGPRDEARDAAGELQPTSTAILRIANYGDRPVEVGTENIFLEKDEQRIYAQAGSSVSGSVNSLGLPVTLGVGEVSGGVVFVGIPAEQLGEWQLVFDLRYEGLGEARFSLD